MGVSRGGGGRGSGPFLEKSKVILVSIGINNWPPLEKVGHPLPWKLLDPFRKIGT